MVRLLPSLIILPVLFACGDTGVPCDDNLVGQKLETLSIAEGWCPGLVYDIESCDPDGEFYCVETSDECASPDHPDCYVGCGVMVDPTSRGVVCYGAQEYD